MKRTQIKLNIVNDQLREDFINHVDSVAVEYDIVLIVAGTAIIMEYPITAYKAVYYKSFSDFANNNPFIYLGSQSTAEVQELNNGDREAIAMKRYTLPIMKKGVL